MLLAPLQNAAGTLVGSNSVIYSNAFKGLNADLEYIFKKSGLEQNIVYREQPPAPDALGLNPATTRLQAWSEFFSPPEPTSVTWTNGGIEEDALLRFGAFSMPRGEAFYYSGQGQPAPGGLGTVSKHWRTVDGTRHFLIEEIDYRVISNALQALPLHASRTGMGAEVGNVAMGGKGSSHGSTESRPTEKGRGAVPMLPLRPVELAAADMGPMRVAARGPAGPEFVMDYALVGASADNYVFQSDTTYLVTSTANLYGKVVFEAGTVVKFTGYTGGYYCQVV